MLFPVLRPSRGSRRGLGAALLLALALVVTSAGSAPSTSAAGTGTGTIAGKVTDLHGKPLDGVKIRVYVQGPIGKQWVATARTNGKGAYAVTGLTPYAYYKVSFQDPQRAYASEYFRDTMGFAFATWVAVIADQTTGGVNAALAPAATISGRLTAGDGSPIAGGLVTLWQKFGATSYWWIDDFYTDADGKYVIDGVGSATYHLEFYSPQLGLREYWNDKADLFHGDDLVVEPGDELTFVDALLIAPPPAPQPPNVTNMAPPTIFGAPQVGQPLVAGPGVWSPPGVTMTYRWVVGDGLPTPDLPTGDTYVPTTADVGTTIRVYATAAAVGWVPGTAWSSATAPVAPASLVVNTKRPRIKGDPRVGERLRATTGRWSPTEVRLRYRWYAGGKAIAHATHRGFTVTTRQVGKRLTVTVTARAAADQPLTVRSARTSRVRP